MKQTTVQTTPGTSRQVSTVSRKQLPVLFVSHGSPMLALEPESTIAEQLSALGAHLHQYSIKAVLVISAHWLSRQTAQLTSAAQPDIIYDFHGFPEELYELNYAAQGAPEQAVEIQRTLQQQGLSIELEPKRGLDHGAWIPLRYIFPQADLPILQLSIPYPMDAAGAITFGKALLPLREQGILILASGSLTHNLHDVRYGTNAIAPYVEPFVTWTEHTLHNHDLQALENYRSLAPGAQQAHPTDEHFLPLVIATAASTDQDKLRQIHGGITYSALSMDAFLFEPSGA